MDDLDALEAAARGAEEADAVLAAATTARERYDAREAGRAAWEDLGDYGSEVLALIAEVRAARAALAVAYPRALQAAADVVLRAEHHCLDLVDEGHEQGRAAGDAAGYARGANRMARAMVAALYWRAGECRMWAAEESEPTYLLQTWALEATAYRLERAL